MMVTITDMHLRTNKRNSCVAWLVSTTEDLLGLLAASAHLLPTQVQFPLSE
jgi:hypothetical protein